MKNLWLILLLLCVRMPLAVADSPRPNILYFYVDDMGWGSIGPNAQAQRRATGQPYVRTPNLDQLAAQGVNFRRGYGCHVCSPARSSQQSGFHQGHTFADRNDPDNAKKAMRSDEVLMGDALAKAGYATGYWGKWGYGGSKDLVRPVIDNIQTLPTSHGYQFVLAELHHVRAHTFFQPTLWQAPAAANARGGLHLVANSLQRLQGSSMYPNLPARQDDPDYPQTAYCDDAYAFAALDFVRAQGTRNHESGQPFFGILAAQIPHAPFNQISTLPGWDSAYASDPQFAELADQTRQWAAMVTRIDGHIGNILAALEDPNNDGDKSDSVAENTLVIFQSDNGGPSGRNCTELDANGGLRGFKGQIQEGGIRVPLIMRWPAQITAKSVLKAGSQNSQVVDVTDLLPTFCELAGVPSPLGVDGVSIAPTLQGSGHQRHRDFIIHEASNGQSIIRGNLKLVRTNKSKVELYDLQDDPGEKHDMAADQPAMARELEELLLGERVDEPAGFATTYHHWIGADGGLTSDADNWSDYVYENEGVTYLADAGAPQLSWIARLENTHARPQGAHVARDLQVLALEIRGNIDQRAAQVLSLEKGVRLTGRNEIRIAALATVTLNQSQVSSLRWIDILRAGTLNGNGAVDATLYNAGRLAASGVEHPQIRMTADYHQAPSGVLQIPLNSQAGHIPYVINGDAVLSGTLEVVVDDALRPAAGESFTVLTAKRVLGTFDNQANEVVANDGSRFRIDYSDATSVRLNRLSNR